MSYKIKNTFLLLCTICIFSTNITYSSALSDFLNSFFNYTPAPTTKQSGFQKTEAENADSSFLSGHSESVPTIAKYYPQITDKSDTPSSFFSNTPSLTADIPKPETDKATTPLAKILYSVLKKESNVQSIRNVFGTSQPTKEEIQNFQKENKLYADGTIGPNTIKKIQKQAIENGEINNESQNGTSKKDFATGKTEPKPESKTFQELLNLVNKKSNNEGKINETTQANGVKDGNHNCNANNYLRDKRKRFTKLDDCWIQGDTGHFGTEWNGKPDITPGKTKGFNMANAKTTSMASYAEGKKVNILNPELGIVSLPLDVQRYYFGNDLTAETIKRKYSGTPIEIVNISNNKCVVAPLWETGPGDNEISKPKAIDLTPIVKKQIASKNKDGVLEQSFISKFRPVPSGKKGCEDYELVFVFQDQIKKIGENTQVAEVK